MRPTLRAVSLAREANSPANPADARHLIKHRMVATIQAVDPAA